VEASEIEELASLVDPSQFNPALPSGHPFKNVQSSEYWSATSLAGFTSSAWAVDFRGGGSINGDKFVHLFVWYVRGGQGIDGIQ
jgi:uncharacterized protein DUF1566